MYHKELYFETIKSDDYNIFHLEYHKDRIGSVIGKNIPLDQYIYPPSSDLLKVKVVYDQDGIIDIFYDKYTPKNINKFQLVYDDKIIYDKKMLNRDCIDRLYDQRGDAQEIIIIKNDLVTDTSIANIAILYNNIWITPHMPLLKGTTRARYIKQGVLKPTKITTKMLYQSEKIALLNAMVDFKILDSFEILN